MVKISMTFQAMGLEIKYVTDSVKHFLFELLLVGTIGVNNEKNVLSFSPKCGDVTITGEKLQILIYASQ